VGNEREKQDVLETLWDFFFLQIEVFALRLKEG
jgi:hypothetical protein